MHIYLTLATGHKLQIYQYAALSEKFRQQGDIYPLTKYIHSYYV